MPERARQLPDRPPGTRRPSAAEPATIRRCTRVLRQCAVPDRARLADPDREEALARSIRAGETETPAPAVDDAAALRPMRAGLGNGSSGSGGVPRGMSPTTLMAMQRLAGNRATVQALGRRPASNTLDTLRPVDEEEAVDGGTGGSGPPRHGVAQAGVCGRGPAWRRWPTGGGRPTRRWRGIRRRRGLLLPALRRRARRARPRPPAPVRTCSGALAPGLPAAWRARGVGSAAGAAASGKAGETAAASAGAGVGSAAGAAASGKAGETAAASAGPVWGPRPALRRPARRARPRPPAPVWVPRPALRRPARRARPRPPAPVRTCSRAAASGRPAAWPAPARAPAGKAGAGTATGNAISLGEGGAAASATGNAISADPAINLAPMTITPTAATAGPGGPPRARGRGHAGSTGTRSSRTGVLRPGPSWRSAA